MTFQRPAHLTRAGQLSKAAMQGLGGRRPPSLSIAGNQFTPIDALGNSDLPFEQTFIDVVVVEVNPNKSKLLFDPDISFGSGGGAPPICYSNNGESPANDSPEPQSYLCRDCYWNTWGSKIGLEGRKVKACSDHKKVVLYLVRPQYPHQLMLSIPPNSFANLTAYTGWLHSKDGTDIGEVVTRIRFAPKPSGTLEFAIAESKNGDPQWVTPKFLEWLDAQDRARWVDMLGMTEQPIAKETPLRPRPKQTEWLTAQKSSRTGSSGAALEAPRVTGGTTPPPSPPTGSEAKRAVGRPRKVVEAPPAAETPPSEFLDRKSPGMVNDAPAPDSELGDIIDNEFGL